MTPKPPPSSDGSSVPPRHRPNLGNLAKDTTEMDLWAFDDLDADEETPKKQEPKRTRSGIPSKRDPKEPVEEKKTDEERESGLPKPVKGTGDSISVNVSQKQKGDRSIKSRPAHAQPGGEFDELDSWDDGPHEVTPPSAFKQMEPLTAPEPEPESVAPTEVVKPKAASQAPPEDDREEFSPKVRADIQQGSLRPHLGLSKVERLGLVALVILLVAGSAVFYFNTISRLPAEPSRASESDFPILGEKVGVSSAVTFWREPVTTGANPDTVRRGSLLIPVVELAISGGPAAVRIFFRDSNGDLVGDAVSRAIRGDEKFQVAATAGFEDFGKHDAYRTGEEKAWTIEVLEAPSETSPTEEFKSLFVIPISTDRR